MGRSNTWLGSERMKNLFLKKKPCSILLLLKDSQQQWYPSKLARVSGSSYVHAVNLLSALKAFGVVTVEKTGKQNIYRLTEKGAYIALSLDDFSKKCESQEQEAKKPSSAPPQQVAPSPSAKSSEKQAQQPEKK
jgi:predicted transcriptional regulator